MKLKFFRLAAICTLITTLFLTLFVLLTHNSIFAVKAASTAYTLTVIVEPPYGGWLIPGAGTHTYEAGTVVSIYWWHSPDYNLESYDINGTILGWKEITRPYNITMDANYVLKATYSQIFPLQVSLNPLLIAASEGSQVSFVATSQGGVGRKTYVWYMNSTVANVHVSVDSDGWSFVPSAAGTYYVFVKVNSEWSAGDIVESETAKVIITPPSLSASVTPLSTSILVGQSVTFASTVLGGYAPYSYQWYLNDNPVSDTNETSWAFIPAVAGTYHVYLEAADARGNFARSEIASVLSSPSVPVGGYSISLQPPINAETVFAYVGLIAATMVIFAKMRAGTRRKR